MSMQPVKKICLAVNYDSINDDEVSRGSSDALQIDTSESPNHKAQHDAEDQKILDELEEEIEKQLDEKASKSNLTATNVKNILRHVITNEHVLAMVRRTVGANVEDTDFVYEPKLTRAKAKELFQSQNPPVPWMKGKKRKSKVHILVTEELSEDSDDDEYVPRFKQTKIDAESHVTSDAESQPATPATPASVQSEPCPQEQWTEDGVFKVPPAVQEGAGVTDENIALRTRSKLSLNDTPLEEIEEAFIPPDITTDMYDLECDDEDWKDFLKKFTRPLDEVVQGTQDEEDADPEYNVLADEDLDTDDKEELREDRGVKITKKELNTLVSELIEFADMFSDDIHLQNGDVQPSADTTNPGATIDLQTMPEFEFVQIDKPEYQLVECVTAKENDQLVETDVSSGVMVVIPQLPLVPQVPQDLPIMVEVVPETTMSLSQFSLLQQQLRQHVQLATQHFLLTYENPDLANMADDFRSFLVSLREGSADKPRSAFHIQNLPDAIKLVDDWVEMFKSNGGRAQKVKDHMRDILGKCESRKHRNAKLPDYLMTFPPFLMKTVVASPVFLYPTLLPKIAFKGNLTRIRVKYLPCENELIALGLEQFIPFLSADRYHVSRLGKVKLYHAAHYINKYMMPIKETKKLYNHIKNMNESNSPSNPIKYYFQNDKAPLTMHFVVPLETHGVVAPRDRDWATLPHHWQEYLKERQTCIQAASLIEGLDIPQCRPRYRPIIKKPTKEAPKPTKVGTEGSKELVESTQEFLIFKKPVVVPDETQVQAATSEDNLIVIESSSDCTELTNGVKVEDEEGPFSVSTNRTELPDEPEFAIVKEETPLECDAPAYSEFGEIRPCRIASCDHTKHKDVNKYSDIPKELLSFKFNSAIFKRIGEDTMLPSMPFLMTPSKGNTTEADTTPRDCRETDDFETDGDSAKVTDNEDEINALMLASSTIQKNKRLPSCSEKKKAKQRREYSSTLTMLSPETKEVSEEKANRFAQAYYDKVQERLQTEAPDDYQRFMEVLSEHDETASTVSELYERIEDVLGPNHPDLCEEFLMFLTPEQAKQIGKLVPHFMLSNMSLFLRKLEIYYSNQPAQLKKIYKGLTDLAANPDVTMETVKAAVLPLLKGSSLLVDWFLQMFPAEAPPESMMSDWEQVDCNEGDDENEQENFESIVLPEVEDPYGGPNCICRCHQISDEMYASRARHCIPCGTKFLQGRVYVQTGKGLRLANVTFNNSTSDHNKRLNVKPTSRQKRKIDTSPSKILMSPTKEEEPRHSNESEDEASSRKQKSPKAATNTSKRVQKPTKKSVAKSKGVAKNAKGQKYKSGESTASDEVCKSEIKIEELTEYEMKSSPVESMDTCEESSQDTTDVQQSDSDTSEDSHSDKTDASDDPDETECDNWTRDEDKIILQTFQSCGKSSSVFKSIHNSLSSRSLPEIKHRFQRLMNLLQKMTYDT